MSFLDVLLDNWRDRVVPVLWALFWAGVLIGGASKIDRFWGSSSGLSFVARSAISQGLRDHLPGRLGFFDSWASGEVGSEDSSDRASAGAVVRYLSHDGGARLVLGSKGASGLILWSGQMAKKLFLGPILILSAVTLVGSSAMMFVQDRRLWRTMSYFSSRIAVISSYGTVVMGICRSFGELWLLGSAASRLTDLPATVPLWATALSSGPLIRSSVWLVAVFCLSSALEALFPDP